MPTASAFKVHSEVWSSFPFTAGADYVIAELEKVEVTVGIVIGKDGKAVDFSEDTDATLIYKADKVTVKKSTTSGQSAWSAGALLYLDEAEKAVCDESSGNVACGIALTAATAAQTVALIHLDGMLSL